MAAKPEAAKKQYEWIQPTTAKVDVGKKKKESKHFLGGLTPHNIIDQEDSDIESTVVWRDPFRMSVLDFQRSALDKVAEVLKIFIKYATEKGPLKDKPLQREGFKTGTKETKTKPKTSIDESLEDLHYQLHHIKFQKEEYAKLLLNLGQGDKSKTVEAINTKCDMLINARNLTAHQAYIKDDITPPHKPSKTSKNTLGAGHFPLRDTRTFKHTKDVVVTCLEFAEKVLEGMEEAKQIDKSREVRARVENLQLLKQEFMEFIEYRDFERHNLEAFHGDRVREEEQKAAAMEVLAALRERVEKGDDDVTKLLACVVAPRCCIKLETPSS